MAYHQRNSRQSGRARCRALVKGMGMKPTDTSPEAVERYEAARRVDRALNTPSSALKEIRELKARADLCDPTQDDRVKELIDLLRLDPWSIGWREWMLRRSAALRALEQG